MEEYIETLRKEWKPETKEYSITHYHGSKKGDEENIILYYNVYNGKWENKEMAFKGYVFFEIVKFL
jgi:hypothetical protein